jgi:uncharacterized coiled-coil protein SlyX
MTDEQRLLALENRVQEQEQVIKELYQHAVSQQNMINDLKAKQLNSQENFVTLSTLVMNIAKSIGIGS